MSSRLTDRAPRGSTCYLKTLIRGSRLQNAARILVLVELSRRLRQAYRFAYDKQTADQLLPQNSAGTAPIRNLGSNVQTLLNYKSPKQQLTCGEAVQKLLDTAAGKFPKWKGQNSKTFMEAFGRIASQRGFVAEMPPGTSHYGGTVDGDAFAFLDHNRARAAIAYLHPFRYYGAYSASINAQAQVYYAFTALHETFHPGQCLSAV